MVLSVSGLRDDGRRATEVRKLKCQLGTVGNHDGSATVHMGLTVVNATVQGPREVSHFQDAKHDRAILRCTVCIAPFSSTERKKRRAGDRRSVGLSTLLQETFSGVVQTHLFNNCEIDITVNVLAADGGYISACINAVSLALVDAGVPMLDVVTSCSVGIIDDTCVVDLNYNEENQGGAEMTVAIMPKYNSILTVKMGGNSRINSKIMKMMLENAKLACNKVYQSMDNLVIEHTSRLLES
mmetsp:Transcript_6969/g.8427  ORF Transcript_6969/g.8427 Transcript_6969/m.8427 type:complete len:240 (-) Transcript_6969:738-1457(-)